MKQLNQLKTQTRGISPYIGSSCTCLKFGENPACVPPSATALPTPEEQTTIGTNPHRSRSYFIKAQLNLSVEP